jgi:hypothetical protein
VNNFALKLVSQQNAQPIKAPAALSGSSAVVNLLKRGICISCLVMLPINTNHAYANGIIQVFDYFDFALSGIENALDQNGAIVSNKFMEGVSTQIDINKDEVLAEFKESDPESIRNLAKIVKGNISFYLDNAGGASAFIAPVTQLGNAKDLISGFIGIGTAYSKLDDLSEYLGRLVSEGKSDFVTDIVTAISLGKPILWDSGLVGINIGGTQLNDSGFYAVEAGLRDTIDTLIQNRRQDVADALLKSSAVRAQGYFNKLLNHKEGKAIISEEIVINILKSNGIADSALRNQNLTTATYVVRWGPIPNGFIFGTHPYAIVNAKIPVGEELYVSEPTPPEQENPISSPAVPLNTDIADDAKSDLIPTNPEPPKAPQPPASGRFFGLLSFVGERTRTTSINGTSDSTEYDQGMQGGEALVLSQTPGADAVTFGSRPTKSDPLRFSSVWPDDDVPQSPDAVYSASLEIVSSVKDVSGAKDRFGAGVFTNLAGETYDRYQYQHTAWGKWNGFVAEIDKASNGVATTEYNTAGVRGYWIVGENTTSQAILNRAGKANYEGAFIGDYVAAGSDTVQQGVAYGKVNYVMDFESNNVSGEAKINLKLQDGTFVSNWFGGSDTGSGNLGDGIITHNMVDDKRWFEEGGNFNQNMTHEEWLLSYPKDQRAILKAMGPVFETEVDEDKYSVDSFGMFYGNTGSEVGGLLDIRRNDGQHAGEVHGVFRAIEQPGALQGGPSGVIISGGGTGGGNDANF